MALVCALVKQQQGIDVNSPCSRQHMSKAAKVQQQRVLIEVNDHM